MATDYTAGAMAAHNANDLQAAMNDIDQKAQADKALQGPLNTSAQMWQTSYNTITAAAQSFPMANRKLVDNWRSPVPVATYQQAADDSTNSLIGASTTILGSNGPGSNQGGGSIPAMLTGLANFISFVADATAQYKAAFDKAMEAFNSDLGAQALEDVFVEINRPTVVAAGQQLNRLVAEYERVGPQLAAKAQSLQWKGPGAGNTLPPAGPGTGPSTSPGGGPGSNDSADQPGGTPGGEAPGGTAGGEQPGGAPGGATPGGAPGGQTPGQVPGSEVPGGLPSGPGTGLAGVPGGLVVPPFEQGVPPNVPLAPAGHGAVPGGAVALPGGIGGGGIGRGGLGGGGLGGGGLGGGLGGGKTDVPRAGGAGGGDKQIPRAAAQLSPQVQASGGRAPAPVSGTGLAGSPVASGGTSGGVPPMMPPGAGMGAGGGGRAGKSGAAGTIRPAARKRDRQGEQTPGVPAGLRGKAGKDLPGAFPPAVSKRRSEKAPAETLQLLDEDLWKVENPDTAVPERRYAH